MSLYVAVPVLVGVALLGWLSGLWTFKRSQRWCPACGRTLKCPDCHRAGLHTIGTTPR